MKRFSLFLAVLAVCLSVATSLVRPAAAQTQLQDYDIPGGHFYSQANGQGGGGAFGYRITDEDGIAFWSEFKRLGGVDVLGYPATRRFILDGFVVQATQRVIMQWRPEVKQVYFVNVFDKLHDLGKDDWLQATKQIPPQLLVSFDAGQPDFNAITRNRLRLLDENLTLSGRFYNGQNLATILILNGLPTSRITDVGPALVVRAQRVAFQLWKVDMPFAKKGEVTQVLGGDIAKDPQAGIIPADAQITETAAGTLSATPTPVATATPVAIATPVATATPIATATATATPKPAFPYLSKEVTTPPIDCGSGNRVPCLASAPNAGSQYIQGHVIDQSGNGISGITVRAVAFGNVLNQVSEADGLFTVNFASNCPKENRPYQVFIIDGNGNPISDVRTVNYSDCNVAGEFHFDFVRQ